MNKVRLAVNGEIVDDSLYKEFAGIGLIRPEYICRKYNMYITQTKLLNYLYEYIAHLCSLDESKTVLYRFTDLTVNEVNVLYGCDCTMYDNKHFMGIKGVRRHLKFLDSFKKEAEIISKLSRKYNNLGIVIPFISNVQELIKIKQVLTDLDYHGKIGIMMEVPSVYINLQEYIDLNIDLVVVGLNDLTTFTTAKYREYVDFDRRDKAVVTMVEQSKKLCNEHNIELIVAGYLKRDDIQFYRDKNIDVVVNYANLDELDDKFATLHQLSYLKEVKQITKNKIKEMENKKMKFGMPTLFEFNSIQENLEFCRKQGLDFLELNMDLPYCLPENIDVEAVKKYNIEITVHLSEKLEIGEINEDTRVSALRIAKSQMEFFIKNLNVKKFNIHIDRGVYFNIDGKKNYIFEKFKTLYDRSVTKSMQELSEFAVRNNIEICFENVSVSNPVLDSFAKVKNYKGLYYTLDVGHDERNNNTMSQYFMQDEQMIHHMHLHDTDGNKDHFELGTGIIDKKKFLDMARRLGIYVVIEVKSSSALINSLNYLKTIN